MIATGFLVEFRVDRPAAHSHQETARFSREPRPVIATRDPSQLSCVEIYDLASVSHSVRSVSNSVRQSGPSVSANLRLKSPLIARPPHFDCAPLHISAAERLQPGCGDASLDPTQRIFGGRDGPARDSEPATIGVMDHPTIGPKARHLQCRRRGRECLPTLSDRGGLRALLFLLTQSDLFRYRLVRAVGCGRGPTIPCLDRAQRPFLISPDSGAGQARDRAILFGMPSKYSTIWARSLNPVGRSSRSHRA